MTVRIFTLVMVDRVVWISHIIGVRRQRNSTMIPHLRFQHRVSRHLYTCRIDPALDSFHSGNFGRK